MPGLCCFLRVALVPCAAWRVGHEYVHMAMALLLQWLCWLCSDAVASPLHSFVNHICICEIVHAVVDPARSLLCGCMAVAQ